MPLSPCTPPGEQIEAMVNKLEEEKHTFIRRTVWTQKGEHGEGQDPGSRHLPLCPFQGLSRDGLVCPGRTPTRPCSPGEAGCLSFPWRGVISCQVHRSMLSSVGLEKQVCSSFSQNSSSSWIGGDKSGSPECAAGPWLQHALSLR